MLNFGDVPFGTVFVYGDHHLRVVVVMSALAIDFHIRKKIVDST